MKTESAAWWKKIRAKLRSSGRAEVEPHNAAGQEAPSEQQEAHGLGESSPKVQDAGAPVGDASWLKDASLVPPLPPSYERMHDVLVSAAPSEPASMASMSHGSAGGALFSNSAQTCAVLLPRMAAPMSEHSAYVTDGPSSVHPVQPVVVMDRDPTSLDARTPVDPSTSTSKPLASPTPAASEANQPQQQHQQLKLTAATLGTHSTLSEGVVKQHRGQRKMHFIKSWLQDAEVEQSLEDSGAGSGTNGANSMTELNHSPLTPALPSPSTPSQGIASDSLPHPPPARPPPLQPQPLPRSVISISRPSQPQQPPSDAAAASPFAAPVVDAQRSGQGDGASRAALLPSPHLTSQPVAHTPSDTTLPTHTGVVGSLGSLAIGEGEPGGLSQPAVARAASKHILESGRTIPPSGIGRTPSDAEGVMENFDTYLPSAVTSMTMTSQVEGPDIPKRVAGGSQCSLVIASSGNNRMSETSVPPPSLRLPAAASSEATKVIAVASHCPQEMASQTWSVDDFVLVRKLYEGALSVICQAQHKKSRKNVALKIYKRSRLHEMERFQLAREICLHIRILHPHILPLYAAWKDSKYVYLVLEWAPHGNLFELLVSRGGKLPEVDTARHVVRPLLSSLAFLHSHGWLHRDIKLENVLLDAQGLVKLCDFGLAIDQKYEQANTRLGTFGYFAPEVLDCPLKKGPFDFKGEAGVPTYDCKVDVWSLGVMTYELLTGKAPFAASSAAKIIEAIRSREITYPPTLSAGARDFLAAALTRDPAARASADELLRHTWLLACCGGPSST